MKLLQHALDFDGRRLQGARPFAVLESKDGAWKWEAEAPFPFGDGSGDGQAILDQIRDALQWSREQKGTLGAAIGYFSYDFARTLEPRAFSPAAHKSTFAPDVRLEFFEELDTAPAKLAASKSRYGLPDIGSSSPPQEYSRAIERIREYIASGDIYQANFAVPFSVQTEQSAPHNYETLRGTHAAPFSALLEWEDFAIVSNSPERFLKIENGIVTAQPIKGTARRRSTFEDDAAQREALAHSAKDRAENVMIVDLLRNDIGRVCEYGTIQVPSLWEVQTFPTLHHLVSTVNGKLRSECDAVDAFAAAFPCGSITGAPKIRAMQIIDELESTPRGVAFGAIGYFGFNGDMEWNVAIRTMTLKDGVASFHAGGGIVWDSNPADEWAEVELKASALRRVLSCREPRLSGQNDLE